MRVTPKRKSVLYVIASVMMASLLIFTAGCGNTSQGKIVEGKVNVVTSFYPLYYMASEIGGDEVNVMNLIPTGVEPHDWTPKSLDLQNASKAQVLIYQGSGFEGWIDDFKKGLDSNSQVKLVEASTGISLIASEESEADHDHDHDGDAHDEAAEDHDHAAEEAHDHAHDHGGVDPHTWVSPKSALIMAKNVKQALVDADPAHESLYEERYQALHEKLEALDQQYMDQLTDLSHREIVVSHQAFGYLARDYQLAQHSIMGLSPEAEPTAQELVRLSKLVKEQGLKYIFFEELVTDQLASTLANEADVETLVLNPLEGLTEQQEQAGDNYISLMERNLENLVKALK